MFEKCWERIPYEITSSQVRTAITQKLLEQPLFSRQLVFHLQTARTHYEINNRNNGITRSKNGDHYRLGGLITFNYTMSYTISYTFISSLTRIKSRSNFFFNLLITFSSILRLHLSVHELVTLNMPNKKIPAKIRKLLLPIPLYPSVVIVFWPRNLPLGKIQITRFKWSGSYKKAFLKWWGGKFKMVRVWVDVWVEPFV